MSRASTAVLLLSVLLINLSARSTLAHTGADRRAEVLVRAAIAKLGGEEKLRALKAMQIEGIGHTYFIEQSERPEGPWYVNYNQITELRDYANQRLRRTTQSRNIQAAQWTNATTLIFSEGAAATQSGERISAGSATQAADAEEALALSSERVLLSALDAKDLHSESASLLQGTSQHTIAFSWHDATVRVYFSAFTAMPTAIEIVRAYPASTFWSVWGDVRTRIYLSGWYLEPGGIRCPHQWDVERNGTPYQTFTVTSLRLNPAVDANLVSIPIDVRKTFETRAHTTTNDLPLGLPNRPAIEIASGVVQIPGNWNVALVKQSDGLVIIEAPISSGYSDKVITEAKKRFPDLPIKAVISTSDSWPHIGGVRDYLARSVPIYALDLNQPILERVVAAPHRANPDALERTTKKKPKFLIVSKKTIVGSGSNRIELYPIRTETGERMMMIYFPEHKLLYGSDLVQPRQDGSYSMPEYLLELIEAVRREGLVVNQVFAMHSGVKPWAEIETAVSKATASSAGD